MTAEARSIADSLGAMPTSHNAQSVTREMTVEADLVLTMTRDQRRQVVQQSPVSSRWTFTLIEFARLLELVRDAPESYGLDLTGQNPKPLKALIGLAASRRGFVFTRNPEDDDIIDPYRRSLKTYEKAGSLINEATLSIFDSVRKITDL
jgi:protein-tyrosine phosphatase